ncbi:C-C motif chemokine 19-like [Narcine bancroftii]|uniref:C-C motif chemokine 19-like n=1 Tax=Narcine bancroftii TaxID=1343680 RepID=UPI0038315935
MARVSSAFCLLTVVVAALWTLSQANGAGKSLQDCCLDTSPKKIPATYVVGFEKQKPGSGCNIHAIIFLTMRNKRLCAPPGLHWVKKLIKIVKWKEQHQKRHKNQKFRESRN